MGKKAKLSKKEYEDLLTKFDVQLDAAAKNIKNISNNLKVLMTGSNNEPYWNGASAYSFYQAAQANLNKDIVAYENARKVFNKLKRKYVSLSQKGYFTD